MINNKPTKDYIRYILGSLLLFVSLNAFAGGYYGISGAENVPLEWLQGSPFRDYLIPSIFLVVCIGGTALFSAIVVFRQHKIASKSATYCGIIILLWLTVQVTIIGYISWMQPTTAIAALLIIILSYQLPKYEH